MNIEVLNTPEAPAVSVAEFALGLMLSLARKISYADRTTHEAQWNKNKCLGYTLNGKKLGLLGFGNIAKHLAKISIAMGMDVGVYSRFSKGQVAIDEAKEIGCSIYASVEDLLKDAHIVSLHLPSSPQTENLINQERIKLMRKDAILVNTARGNLIEENALAFATVDSEGNPHCIAVGDVKVASDDKILVGDNYMNKTLKNIQKNPNVALVVWSKDESVGYRLQGTAEYFSEGKWLDKVKAIPENKEFPCKGAILINVNNVKKLG